MLSRPVVPRMTNILTNFVLAFSMSADAFAAALGKGAALHKPPLKEAIRTGAIFGIIETITPIIGWGVGLVASSYVRSIDHWIAFVLLCLIGARMIWESKFRPAEEEKPNSHSFAVLAMTAVGTSIDAMAVGVTLAFIDADIVVTSLSIGVATFLMATIGIKLGNVLGSKFGRVAEAIGGVGLILIGTNILLEHLFG